MKSKRAVLLTFLFVFALVWVGLMSIDLSGRGSAVGADRSRAEIRWIDKGNLRRIALYLAVFDGAGQTLFGLEKDNFRVREDGIPVRIIDFVGAGYQPITAILLIDRSRSMGFKKMAGAKEAALAFIQNLQDDRDRIGIIAFNHQEETIFPLKFISARERPLLEDRIGYLYAKGGTAYYDTIYHAVEELRAFSGRKVVIALTDGIDEHSRRSLSSVIGYAQNNEVPLFTIGLGYDVKEGVLETMAGQTGGEYHFAPSADELADLYRGIAQRLQNEYSLTYESPTPQLDGTKRKVVVTVAHPGATISAAQDYSVAGVLAPSINPLLFFGLLASLLIMLGLPSLFPQTKPRPGPVPEVEPEPEAPLPTPALPPDQQSPVKVAPAPVRARLVGCPGSPASEIQYVLDKSVTPISIGSAASNDIVIPGLLPRHAELRWQADRWVIRDLGGGVFVSFSGDPAQMHAVFRRNALQDGSRVRLGEAIFVFRTGDQG